jgi:hypothetical protein
MKKFELLLKGDKREWYQIHQNTSLLLKAVVGVIGVDKLSGDQIWQLLRLTLITMNAKDVSPNHWRTLKVPALAGLFHIPEPQGDDLQSTIGVMDLPGGVASAAILPTGVVNFRPVWRNTARRWC